MVQKARKADDKRDILSCQQKQLFTIFLRFPPLNPDKPIDHSKNTKLQRQQAPYNDGWLLAGDINHCVTKLRYGIHRNSQPRLLDSLVKLGVLELKVIKYPDPKKNKDKKTGEPIIRRPTAYRLLAYEEPFKQVFAIMYANGLLDDFKGSHYEDRLYYILGLSDYAFSRSFFGNLKEMIESGYDLLNQADDQISHLSDPNDREQALEANRAWRTYVSSIPTTSDAEIEGRRMSAQLRELFPYLYLAWLQNPQEVERELKSIHKSMRGTLSPKQEMNFILSALLYQSILARAVKGLDVPKPQLEILHKSIRHLIRNNNKEASTEAKA